jgi:hypothetical protein
MRAAARSKKGSM